MKLNIFTKDNIKGTVKRLSLYFICYSAGVSFATFVLVVVGLRRAVGRLGFV